MIHLWKYLYTNSACVRVFCGKVCAFVFEKWKVKNLQYEYLKANKPIIEDFLSLNVEIASHSKLWFKQMIGCIAHQENILKPFFKSTASIVPGLARYQWTNKKSLWIIYKRKSVFSCDLLSDRSNSLT